MKKCPKCQIEKKLDQFNKNGNKLASWCKECVKLNCKLDYENHKEIRKEKFIKQNRKKTEFLASLKKDKFCEKCGYNKCYVALDYHHIDPSKKKFKISESNRTIGVESLKILYEEIEKCLILCANCHREFHFLERKNKITIQEYLNKMHH